MNKHQKLNEEHQAQMAGLSNPDCYTFVDIGLPDFYEVHKADLLAKNGAELPLEINDEDLPE